MAENERIGREDPVFNSPDSEKINCKDCAFRMKDAKVGKSVISGASKAFCDVYPKSPGKPSDVLWKGGDCEYYVSEKNKEDTE